MKVIISGGTGFIGSELATSLVSDGNDVIVLSRDPARVHHLPANVRVEYWDGRTTEGWGKLTADTDAIVNLAGEGIDAGRWDARHRQRIIESRVTAGQAIVQAIEASAKKPSVLIQASAVGYYGARSSEEIGDDGSSGDDFMAKICLAWEASTTKAETYGVRRVVIRTGAVLSPKHGALRRMLFPFKMGVGGPVGGGKQWLSWIHIDDEVRAIRFLLDNQSASGNFNLTAPGPLTNRQFSKALGQVLRRPAIMPIPAFALRLIYGEMSRVILDGQRVLPVRLLKLGFEFHFRDIEAALRDLLKER